MDAKTKAIKEGSVEALKEACQWEQEQAYLMWQDGSWCRNKGKYQRHLDMVRGYQKEIARLRALVGQEVER